MIQFNEKRGKKQTAIAFSIGSSVLQTHRGAGLYYHLETNLGDQIDTSICMAHETLVQLQTSLQENFDKRDNL
jgi:hypothetical protein